MPEELPKKRKHGLLRRGFRYCRIAVLSILLVMVGAVTYLSQVGLPDFVRDSLLQSLEERGLEARFSELRWQWHEGVVAENLVVELKEPGGTGPRFSADRASLRFDMNALGRLRWRIAAAELHNGDLNWVLSDTNHSEQLRLSDIETLVRFQPNGSIELVRFDSKFKGLDLDVTGLLANPGRIQRSSGATNRPQPNILVLNETMNRVADYLTEFEFTRTPELFLRFDADAADWSTLTADLRARMPGTTTTWGDVNEADLLARLRPPKEEGGNSSIELSLLGNRADTPWGLLWNWEIQTRTVPVFEPPMNSSNEVSIEFGSLETEYGTVEEGRLDFVVDALAEDRPDQMNVSIDIRGERFITRWGNANSMDFHYQGTISRTNWLPIMGTNVLSLEDVRSDYGVAGALRFAVAQKPQRTNWRPQADETWGAWRYLEPYILDFSVSSEAVDAFEVQVESAKLAGSWSAPKLEVSQLHGTLYGGDMDLSGEIDVSSGLVQYEAVTDWDYHGLEHKFTEKFRNWFAPYQWGAPPHVEVSGKLVWPDWNLFKPKWKTDLGPSLSLSGTFHAKNPSYRGIPGLEASSHFYLTNFTWHLPDLTMVRPEGTTVAVYDGNDLTKDYQWQLDARLNPHVLAPLFQDKQRRVFQHFTNHVAPHVTGRVWGRWRAHDLIGFEATIDAPEIEIRGESINQLNAHVAYTNRFLLLSDGDVTQSNQVAHAENIGIDFSGQKMFFTNVSGTIPPMSVARTIGPITAKTLEPYVFGRPPKVSMNGTLGLRGHEPTDLQFEIDGEQFSWWQFNIDQIAGRLDWKHQRLTMTNVTSRFYDGAAAGSGVFTFHTNRPTDFSFLATVTNAQLQPLVRDVFENTNNLAGMLSGELFVTEGRSDSRDTWDGYGYMDLKNGMLWDIPIFAIFTPLFNAISPGLGSSQADRATANFVMVNGTIISTDLEIKSTEMNMNYKGSIDHLGNVNALMEARILKEAGPIGPLISTALRPLTKLFEYKLTGTLSEPKAEPIFIPRFLMLALEPFKALGNLLKPSSENSE